MEVFNITDNFCINYCRFKIKDDFVVDQILATVRKEVVTPWGTVNIQKSPFLVDRLTQTGCVRATGCNRTER